ncbi:calmodulin [Bacteroides sp. BFG-257]|uniref:calmodulin n=1 Tax=Bacteroides TaxID=816 RepID=UPI001CD00130|nr:MULTISPECIES: calmodulin [Bacteroides]UBD71781.1 calmodulin [Bacteroides cellulosilyticus]UVP00397.1 calmodulin [Bacteroides sp. BFG-257]
MSIVKVKPFDELSKYVQEANTPGNLLQETPDYDAIRQEEYENAMDNMVDDNGNDDDKD